MVKFRLKNSKKKETKDFLIFPDPYKLQNAGYVAVAVVEFIL